MSTSFLLTSSIPTNNRIFTLRAKANHSTNSCNNKTSSIPLPRLVLHDSLDLAGIDTKHARASRAAFCKEIDKFSAIDAGSSIVINRGVDLANIALHVAAEDDSLVSHSSVPLPVEAFIERLDDLSMGFCSFYVPSRNSTPEMFFQHLERYFYVEKGFHKADASLDARALYLHSALLCRSGSLLMLSLIYSEMLKMLKMFGIVDFDAEIYFPDDHISLPRGYHKQKSQLFDPHHVITSKSLLTEIQRELKAAFWPFRYNPSSSFFLRAAHAANHFAGPDAAGHKYISGGNISASEIASAKAAHHRVERGVWTNVRFGDMRLALAACERLLLLDTGFQELRDYAVLLYHCGFYEECLQFLKLYKSAKNGQIENGTPVQIDNLVEEVTDNLISRVNLILQESGWSKAKVDTSCWIRNREPW